MLQMPAVAPSSTSPNDSIEPGTGTPAETAANATAKTAIQPLRRGHRIAGHSSSIAFIAASNSRMSPVSQVVPGRDIDRGNASAPYQHLV